MYETPNTPYLYISLGLWSFLSSAFAARYEMYSLYLIFQLLCLLNILTESYNKLSLFFLCLSIHSFSLSCSNIIHVTHDPSNGNSKIIQCASEYHSIPSLEGS